MKKRTTRIGIAILIAMVSGACSSPASPAETSEANLLTYGPATHTPVSAPTEAASTPALATYAPSQPQTPTAEFLPTPLTPSIEPGPTAQPPAPSQVPAADMPIAELVMDSAALQPGGTMMTKHSCFGENLSPPLNWTGVPVGTQSLALSVVDPDSHPAGFVHWVIYNIPPTTSNLPEGVSPDAILPDGSLQGSNDFANYPEGDFPGGAPINQTGYDGPCPPGEHRYLFTLYAVDIPLKLAAEATLDQVAEAMNGHVLDQAELVGLFAPP
jgi:Raf kinase inhibitor-like YbhB/YbcL family protein